MRRSPSRLQRFEERAADVERLFGLFRQQQTELGGQVTAEDKAELRRRLDALDDELNRALARDYGVEPASRSIRGLARSHIGRSIGLWSSMGSCGAVDLM